MSPIPEKPTQKTIYAENGDKKETGIGMIYKRAIFWLDDGAGGQIPVRIGWWHIRDGKRKWRPWKGRTR